MKLGLNLQTSLQQSLTPQQIQYLKMLQLPALQLEQHVRVELENNPMLEETSEFEPTPEENERVTGDTDTATESTAYNAPPPEMQDVSQGETPIADASTEFDPQDAFEFQKLLISEDNVAGGSSDTYGFEDEDDDSSFQFRDVQTLEEDLLEQLRYLSLTDEERLFGEYVIGNIDDDGYLRRDLLELVDEMNDRFSEHNLAVYNVRAGSRVAMYQQDVIDGIMRELDQISMQRAEHVLRKVQSLEPPGIASRSVQECLLAQLRAIDRPNAAQKLAKLILTEAYDAFAMKHYHVIERNLQVSEDYLKEAIEVIRKLTPRPEIKDIK